MEMFFLTTFFLLKLLVQVSAVNGNRSLRPVNSNSNQQQPCILVQVDIRFKDGSSLSKWQCELSAADVDAVGNFFVDIEGLNETELKGIKSGVNSLFVEGGSVGNGKLTIPPGAKKSIGRVDKRGPAAQKKNDQENKNNSVSKNQRRLSVGSVDKRLVLVARIVAADSSPTSTLAQMRNFVFGLSGDVSNLRERFQSCSYGEVLMEPFNSTTTMGRIVQNGAYQVTITSTARGRANNVVADAGLAQLRSQLGDLASQFDHVMLCLPPGTSGDWIAYGFFNNWLTVYNNDWCNYPSAQVHEIGHNLNLDHSNEGSIEYDDTTCMMGFSYSQDTQRMCFNAAKSAQLDWYSLRSATLDFSRRGGFKGQFIGIDNYKHVSSAGKYVYVRVLGSPFSKADVFVGFNLARGINADTKEALNQVTVHTMQNGGQKPSYLLAKLSAGNLYTFPNFAGTTSLNVKVNSIDLLANPPVANVDIFLTGCPPGVCGAACKSCCVASDCAPAASCASVSCRAASCVYNTTKCPGDFRFQMTTDGFPEDISWDVVDQCSGQIVIAGDTYGSSNPFSSRSTGVLGQSSYKFIMRDSAGDGLYDGTNTGNFNVTFDGVLVSRMSGDFGNQISADFGGSC